MKNNRIAVMHKLSAIGNQAFLSEKHKKKEVVAK